jgi:type VI protein secretion system component VasF
MNLLELAEPIFQHVCFLNRAGRKSSAGNAASSGNTSFFTKTPAAAPAAPKAASLDYAVVRSELKALFEEFTRRSASDPRLSSQARKVELPLLFFVDSIISESSLPFAAQWNQNRLAYERNELAGDEKFFDLLEETLKEQNDEASERLAVFYACLGLGFTGIYFRQPEYLRKTMLTVAPRIKHLIEADLTSRMCPECYEGVDSRNLVEPPSRMLAFVGILFLCFTLAVVFSYFYLYRTSSQNLKASLENILKQDLSKSTAQK